MTVRARFIWWTAWAQGVLLILAACAGSPRISDYQQARAQSDQALVLMNAGDDAGAIKLLTQVIAYNGGEVHDLTRRATAYAALNQNQAALRDLDRAVAMSPDEWRTYLLRAVVHQKTSQFTDAVQDLDAAIAINRQDAELMRRHAYDCLLAGRFADALADYDQVLRMMPTSTVGRFGRGVSLYLAGNWAEATAEFDRELRSAPSDGIAALWLVKSSLRNHAPLAWEQFAQQSGPEPEWTMIRVLLSDDTAEDVTREIAALRTPIDGRRSVGACEAALFLGTWADLKGKHEGARVSLDSARQTCPADSIENAEARTELARVQRTRK